MNATLHDLAAAKRHSEYGVLPDIVRRWSPRRMTGEALTNEDLAPLLDAARWAPSSFNNQPWRFNYALRDTRSFEAVFNLLVEKNKAWCAHAGCLIILASKRTFDHNGAPMITHSHDTGAAWHAFAVEGVRRGLVVHGMSGFDYAGAARLLELGDEFAVECMIAVGKPAGDVAEETVTDRKPLEAIARQLP